METRWARLGRARAFRSALVLSAVLALSLPSHADPVRLTSGFLLTDVPSRQGFFRVGGLNFQLDVVFEGFSAPDYNDCSPCEPGTSIGFSGEFFSASQGDGSAMVNGVTYSQIWVDGLMGRFTTPTVPIEGSSSHTVTLPFVFEGTVNGYLVDPFTEGFTDPVFTVALGGSGLATGLFHYTDIGGPLFGRDSELRYQFDDAAPVPEPATLLLFGSGTAAVSLLRRRRQKQAAGRKL